MFEDYEFAVCMGCEMEYHACSCDKTLECARCGQEVDPNNHTEMGCDI